ncbi:hypothetical protein PC119_g13082 [Phytophthora cactorum]|nr:hypothetical protein PC119_g13082 [Phytophthora cactorum]
MPASRKSVELSLKRQAIDWIATEGGGVPSRAEAHFCQRGWRVKAACFRRCGNPKPPSIETVVSWVTTARRQVPDSVVKKSIVSSGVVCGISGRSSC